MKINKILIPLLIFCSLFGLYNEPARAGLLRSVIKGAVRANKSLKAAKAAKALKETNKVILKTPERLKSADKAKVVRKAIELKKAPNGVQPLQKETSAIPRSIPAILPGIPIELPSDKTNKVGFAKDGLAGFALLLAWTPNTSNCNNSSYLRCTFLGKAKHLKTAL